MCLVGSRIMSFATIVVIVSTTMSTINATIDIYDVVLCTSNHIVINVTFWHDVYSQIWLNLD